MKTQYYLKTDTEAQLWECLEVRNLAVKDFAEDDELNVRPADLSEDADWEPTGTFTWRPVNCVLHIIGTIYTETGNIVEDEDGHEGPEMAPVDGFHANMIAEVGINGLPTVEKPATPFAAFAGWSDSSEPDENAVVINNTVGVAE